jgi:branched-chain amino acid transport system substrate-binding protein
MRKFIGLALAVLALPALVGIGTASAQDNVIRIPFATAFSGPVIAFGERLWRGGQLALEEVNKTGVRGGMKIEFYKVDSRSPETAQMIIEYRRACANKSIPLFLVNISSKQLFALYEHAKTCNMPTFAPTSGAHWVYPDQGKWIFRFLPVPNLIQAALYKEIKNQLDPKTASASLTIDDDFTFFNMKQARIHLDNNNIEIVDELGSKRQETNFASQVAAVRASRADIIVLSHQPDDGGKFTKQVRDRGIKTQITDTGYTIVGGDYWELSAGTGKGAIGGTNYTSEDPRPIVQNWLKLWRERTGEPEKDPDAYETATYDAVKMLARILDNAKSLDRQDIADAFMTIENMEFITGTAGYREEDLPDIRREKAVLVQLGDNGRLLPWP